MGKRNYIKDFNHPDYPHGELRGYKTGCRCLECKRAKADYNLKQKGVESPAFRKLLGMQPDHPDYPHGTRTGYRYCKCDQCRKANAEYKLQFNNNWRKKPESKQTIEECDKRWRESEAGKACRRASHAKRRAFKKNTRPVERHLLKLLGEIYRHCPEGYHVDHILPLNKGGQHHPDNLQYLPAIINVTKRDNENFDCSRYLIRWQDLLREPSTTIPQGSTLKRVEVPGAL